jgi:predicted Zn-dependent protease with MMP-like domain
VAEDGRHASSFNGCLASSVTEPEVVCSHSALPPPFRREWQHNVGVLDIGMDDFTELVGAALDAIPPELSEYLSNVTLFVEDEHPEEPDLLGLYEGIPLTERDEWYSGVLPDRITVYRLPTLRSCETPEEVVEEVRITVVHEIAHHFGIDDDHLHTLGYA